VYREPQIGKLDVVDLTDNTQVNAAASNTQTLTPPAGKLYRVRMIHYQIATPAGSTAGTHELIGERILVTSERPVFTVKADFNATIFIKDLRFTGNSSELPSNEREQFLLLTNGDLIATNSFPLKFTYNNDTDANQTGNRILEILVEVLNERG